MSKRQESWDRFTQGHSVREVADALGLARSTVREHWLAMRRQRGGEDCHHPREKSEQIASVLAGRSGLRIYEAHSGHGFCTQAYKAFGEVTEHTHDDGDHLRVLHQALGDRPRYDVVDLDPYGFPNRLLAAGAADLLKPEGFLFVTFPKWNVMRRSAITAAMMRLHFGAEKPSEDDYHRAVRLHALAYHRAATLAHSLDLGPVYRHAYRIERMNANTLHGTGGREALIRAEPLYQQTLFDSE